MAQTKKKRQKKRRGTQGGRVDTKGRSSRPRNREEAKARAKSRRGAPVKGGMPPTWRGSTIRGLVAAVIFFALLLLLFGRSAGSALVLAAAMLAFYIPAGYFIDMTMWRRRERSRIRSREAGKDTR